MDNHSHKFVYVAIVASLIISLVANYFMVMLPKIEEVGGMENYKLYQKMVKHPKFAENVRQSIDSQIQSLEGNDAQDGQQQDTPSAVTQDSLKGLFVDGNIHFGSADNKLILVEISDPSCPYCHAAAGKNPELSKQMGSQFVLKADGGSYVAPVTEFEKLVKAGKASFVFLYSNGHGAGELGAQALFCAHEKGKFWDAHDKLMSFAGYNLINNDVKNDVKNAGKLADFLSSSIDSKFMKSCLESGKYAKNLGANEQTAASLGSQGTPGFFVNTKSFSGAQNYTSMESAVADALK